MDDEQLQLWIKKCEGLSLHLYNDTVGVPSIGWGRAFNKPISIDEAELLFQNEIGRAHV